MTRPVVIGWLCATVLVVTGGAAALAESPSGEPRPPETSVWMRFEEPARLDRSSSLDSWPAECAGGTLERGQFGQALSLPGSTGNGIHLPRPTAFFGNKAHAGTIAIWVCPADPQADFVIADFYRRAGNTLIDGNQIVIHSEESRLIARPCVGRRMAIDTPLQRDTWTHLALTWDSARGTRLFVNGERRAQGAAGFRPAELEDDWPGRIGGPTGAGAPFAGKLDELRLWNRMLSDEEVRAVYESAAPAPLPATIDIGAGSLTVCNTGDDEAVLSLAIWAPAASRPPPYWGWSSLPIASVEPDHRTCLVGPVPGKVVRKLTLPAKGVERIDLGNRPEHLGPTQIKLMAGDGIAQGAVAVRELDGLTVKPTQCGLVVLRQAPAVTIDMTIRNGSAEPFQDDLQLSLNDATGSALAEAAIAMRLPAGAEKRVAVKFHCQASPGKYQLTARPAGSTIDVETFPVYVTSDVDAARTHGTAVHVHGRVSEPVLDRVAADGVDAVMLGRVTNYRTFEHDVGMVLGRGMKLVLLSQRYYDDACLNARRRREMKQYACHLGRLLAANPAVVMVTIAGEASSAPVCYCDDCTAGFRAWLRAEYGSVAAMNAAWGTSYADWSAVDQLGSPDDVDERAERLKLMRVDLELPADHTKRWQALFDLDRGRAMAWRKWQDSKLIGMYADFQKSYRGDGRDVPPAGEQPCWPNFNSQNLFAAARVNDIGGMDLYLPGLGPTTLGHPAELLLNFDMNRSVFHAEGKPVAVNELYVQDHSPPGEAEAQGWWLTGRGYGNLDYFTYDYYYEGVRRGLPLIFGMFDKESKPYPCYASFQRFCRDIKTFRALPGIESLRRERPRIALFMGDDMSRASGLETAGNTCVAAAVGGHNGAYWLTERSGFPVDFINDDGFDRLAGKRALIVPWTHVISPDSLDKIVAFARAGATVIVDGPIGLYDDHYQPYAVLPGGKAFSSTLGITFSGYEDRPNRLVIDANAGPARQTAWYRFDSEETLAAPVGKGRQDRVQKAAGGEGKVGSGMVLPGQAGNGLYVANPAAFFGGRAERGTIALWVKPDFDPAEDNRERVLFDFMRRSGNSKIDGHEVVMYAAGGKIVASPALTVLRMEHATPLAQGRWTHLAMTWDCRLGAALYVDGERVKEHLGAFKPVELDADWPGRIGCMTSVGGAPFAGTIDELRLFNDALRPSDVPVLLDDTNRQEPKLTFVGHRGSDVASQGMLVSPQVTKGTVLLEDIYGNPGLVEVPVGRGKIVAFLTSLGRRSTAAHPDPQTLGLWKSLLEEKAGLAGRYRFVPARSADAAATDRTAGTAVARPSLFDLSVQVKDDRELYLFLVSFFGPSAGTVELALPDGEYSAADALTGEKVGMTREGRQWQLPVSLPAGVGGRAIHVCCKSGGKPFADW